MSSSTKIDHRKKGYFNSWKRSNRGIRTNTKCWKKCIGLIGKVDGHIEKINENKYLAFDSTELHSTD